MTKDQSKVIGGRARAEALTARERSQSARMAAMARWNGNLPKATHTGELVFGEIVIPCAVLEDGTRVLTQSGLLRSLGRSPKPHGGAYTDLQGFEELPAFLRSKSLKPFISKDLIASSAPLNFLTRHGGKAIGFRAELLPLVCEVFLEARAAGTLAGNQKATAQQCEMLVRSLAKVGIIALVDEATGYQEVRDRQALQKILDLYLQKEFAAWAKRFPDEFFQQMFRLRDWKWEGMQLRKPQCVGKYINDLVYDRLAPGIHEELRRINPKDERGYRRAKHHQFLTLDVGHAKLQEHLVSVINFMKVSKNWNQFYQFMNIALPRRGATLELPFTDVT